MTRARVIVCAWVAAPLLLLGSARVDAQLFDDFTGPVINAGWLSDTATPSLPNANVRPFTAPSPATYLGAPSHTFETLDGRSVIRLTNEMTDLTRRGWASSATFNQPRFRCEVRFNTLVQSSSAGIDGMLEVWLLDASNPSRYDRVSLFGSDFSLNRRFILSSGVDGTGVDTSFAYRDNTWYRLVITGSTTQNLHLAVYDDAGEQELIGSDLGHNLSVFPSGVRVAISQAMHLADSVADVAIDSVQVSDCLATGDVIPLCDARSPALPTVTGDGVSIDAFNHVGGGAVPAPLSVQNLVPDGSTLSPTVDFPRPGATVNVGNDFTLFFADTTTPPASLASLAASNFTLRITGLLRVSADLDLDPAVPGIQLRLQVISDDGFYLTVARKFLGQAADRGFSGTTMAVSFEGEGLYPFTLFFAANTVGVSGLEFWWETAHGAAIIPQSALYLDTTQCRRKIEFEDLPVGTIVSDQYRDEGVIFTSVSGEAQVTNANPSKFVPVSGDRVFGDPREVVPEPVRVEFDFVRPGTSTPAAVNFFSCFIIDAEATGSTVTAFDVAGAQVFSRALHGGAGTQEQVAISSSNIRKVVITLGGGPDGETSAIDNVCFGEPFGIAPLIAPLPNVIIAEGDAYTGPAPVLQQGLLPVTWSLDAAPAGMTIDPTTGIVTWPSAVAGAHPYVITIRATNAAGSSAIDWLLDVPASYAATVSADVTVGTTGTPVHFDGQVRYTSSNNPAPNELVNLWVKVRGTRRVIPLTSDAEGRIATTFQPLPGEAGDYTFGAEHPASTIDTVQGSFKLVGMKAVPPEIAVVLTPGVASEGEFSLQNLGDVPLTGITASVEGAPAGLDVQINAAASVPSMGTVPVSYSVLATALPPDGTVQIHLASAEGAVADVSLAFSITPAIARLVADPSTLKSGMLRGKQTFVEFDVQNTGGAASAALNVSIPTAPWLALVSSATIGPIAPGATAHVVLAINPAADLPLGPYNGTIVISGGSAAVNVPFVFTAISEGVGELQVIATDEYTFWAPGSPALAGANVTVSDAVSGAVVRTGVTDASGAVLFMDLTEAHYNIEVTAEDHGSAQTTVLVPAGDRETVSLFLPRQLVTYNWTVEPILLEDRYTFTVEALFETNVPAPVITVEPSFVDLDTIGCGKQVNFTITNHGLIAAIEGAMEAESDDNYEITPLIADIGDIPAHASLVVPVLIRSKSADCGVPGSPPLKQVSLQKGVQKAASGAACSSPKLRVKHSLVCGTKRTYRTPVAMKKTQNCGGTSGGLISWGSGSWPGGFVIPPRFTQQIKCDPCTTKCLIAIGECLLGFVPGQVGCVLSFITGGYDLWNSDSTRSLEFFGSSVDTLGNSMIACLTPWQISALYNAYLCYKNLSDKCNKAFCRLGARSASLLLSDSTGDPNLDFLNQENERMLSVIDVLVEIFGDPAWFSGTGSVEEGQAFAGYTTAFLSAMNAGSAEGRKVSAAERATLLALPLPGQLNADHAGAMIDRWNRTQDYWTAGIFDETDVPAGESTDFIARERFTAKLQAANDAVNADAAIGFTHFFEGANQAVDVLKAINEEEGEGVCARVRIQIKQEAMLSRTAFEATLELTNGDTAPLENVSVLLDIRNESNEPSNTLFVIPPPQLTGISDVDGGGSVGTGSSAIAKWLIIPTDEAAPDINTAYFVGGVLSYTQNGTEVRIPLFPAPITVLPNPRLHAKYFLERDVYSDDPFTPETEPPVPFSLGLLMSNSGMGTTYNLRITSGQPQIIDNDKGLLINFKLIGAQVGSQPVAPALTLNLGDIGPAQTKSARWLLTSSLQGKFVEYLASYEHVDSRGDPRLSLVDGVEIHVLNHVVRVDKPIDDGQFDFLVNDIPDVQNLPDRIHSSDGTVLNVTPLTEGTTDGAPVPGDLEVQLTASMPSGWGYLQVANPGGTGYRLVAVLRPDDSAVRVGDNAWTTHRIIRPAGEPPRVEDLLHLVDFDGPGTYRLIYATAAPGAPTLGAATATTIRLLDLGSTFEGDVEHAVFEESTGKYVGADGRLQTEPFWRARAPWAGTFVWNLTPQTAYRFKSKARPGGVETEYGPSASGTTGMPGDVTGSGSVNLGDVLMIRTYLGTQVGDGRFDPRTDVNGDGKVTYADLGLVRRLLPQ